MRFPSYRDELFQKVCAHKNITMTEYTMLLDDWKFECFGDNFGYITFRMEFDVNSFGCANINYRRYFQVNGGFNITERIK